jgi:hypothetical protein
MSSPRDIYVAQLLTSHSLGVISAKLEVYLVAVIHTIWRLVSALTYWQYFDFRPNSTNSGSSPLFCASRAAYRRLGLLERGGLAVFLASDDAANILGATLSVDGGWAAV